MSDMQDTTQAEGKLPSHYFEDVEVVFSAVPRSPVVDLLTVLPTRLPFIGDFRFCQWDHRATHTLSVAVHTGLYLARWQTS